MGVSVRRVAISALLSAGFALTAVGIASAELGAPFASADASSTMPTAVIQPTGPVQPTAHDTYLARVTILAGHTSYYGDAGAVWWEFPPSSRAIAAGASPSEFIPCDTPCGAHVDWFETPVAPVTFSGSITSGPYGSSDIGFFVPTAGHYHADVSLGSGTVIFYGPGDCPNFTPIPALATGTISLGRLAAGANNFCILAPDLTGATWTARIARDAVVVSQATPDRAWIRAGSTSVVSFTASDSDVVDETVIDGSGATVRTLARAVPIAEGGNYVVWDGRADSGARARDGAYRVVITRLGDQPSQASAAVGVDATPPRLSTKSVHLSGVKAALRIHAADAVSGLARIVISTGGMTTTILRVPAAGVPYRPRVGWRHGANRLRVVATDAAGNTTLLTCTVSTPRAR
jgi:FlgD Ig-like domain